MLLRVWDLIRNHEDRHLYLNHFGPFLDFEKKTPKFITKDNFSNYISSYITLYKMNIDECSKTLHHALPTFLFLLGVVIQLQAVHSSHLVVNMASQVLPQFSPRGLTYFLRSCNLKINDYSMCNQIHNLPLVYSICYLLSV